MTPDFFPEAFAYTLGNEGGFTNDPNDYGGPTNWGIIQSEYSRYIGHPASIDEIKHMPKEHAEDIYRHNYWNPLAIARIQNKHVAMALFDRSVLNGLLGVSQRTATALGLPKPVKAGLPIDVINAHDPVKFVMALADACEAAHRARVQQDHSQQKFLRGWLNRVNRMRKELGDGTVRSV